MKHIPYIDKILDAVKSVDIDGLTKDYEESMQVIADLMKVQGLTIHSQGCFKSCHQP